MGDKLEPGIAAAIERNGRITKALRCIEEFGGIDGDHHKQWVLDQVVRSLVGGDEAYEDWVEKQCDGEDGPETYSWDEGIAP